MGVNLYISYETLIGVSYNGERKRRGNCWGPTTGKHINQLGIRDYPEVEEEELERFLKECFKTAALQAVVDQLTN